MLVFRLRVSRITRGDAIHPSVFLYIPFMLPSVYQIWSFLRVS